MSQNNYTAPRAEAKFTADIVVFTLVENRLHVLVVERSQDPHKGSLALPGGFVWENETSQATAERILASKAGVKGVFLEQLYTFDDIQRDSRGRIISISYYALVPFEKLVIEQNNSTEKPTLLLIEDSKSLAFDHPTIIEYAIRRLRNKVNYSNAMYSLLPDSFTFSELHAAYENILGISLDKRNFRKKFLSLGLLEATNIKTEGGRHRPAELYRFASKEFTELNRWL